MRRTCSKRAARSAGPSGNLPPEFAEYDCFACHHDLRSPGWRQERGYDGRQPGLPPWGTWSVPMTAALAERGALDPTVSSPHDLIDGLSRVMLQRRPTCVEVADKATSASAGLRKWAEVLQAAADHKALDRVEVQALLHRLVGRSLDEDAAGNWDRAAQTYLAVAALYQTLAELDPGYATPGRRAAVERLRSAVRFPTALPGGLPDSPADFTPARFRDALKDVQDALRN